MTIRRRRCGELAGLHAVQPSIEFGGCRVRTKLVTASYGKTLCHCVQFGASGGSLDHYSDDIRHVQPDGDDDAAGASTPLRLRKEQPFA